MKLTLLIGTVALALSVTVAQAAENPAEVDAVVAATMAANDKAKLCQSGQPGITAAVGTQVRTMAGQGKIKGNPQAVGAEAGQKIGRSCQGG